MQVALTDKWISVSDDSVGSFYHLIRHAEVKVETCLILAEAKKPQGYCDTRRFAVIDCWTPGCTAPKTTNVRTLSLRDLKGTVRTSCGRERYEFPEGETIEGQLKEIS